MTYSPYNTPPRPPPPEVLLDPSLPQLPNIDLREVKGSGRFGAWARAAIGLVPPEDPTGRPRIPKRPSSGSPQGLDFIRLSHLCSPPPRTTRPQTPVPPRGLLDFAYLRRCVPSAAQHIPELLQLAANSPTWSQSDATVYPHALCS